MLLGQDLQDILLEFRNIANGIEEGEKERQELIKTLEVSLALATCQ